MVDTEIVQTIHMQLKNLKKDFCQHCMDSGLVNPELSKEDRDILLQQHWKKFWTSISKHTSIRPMRMKV